MSADNDVIEGFKTKWSTTSAITDAITGGLFSGTSESGRVMPYAQIDSRQAKSPLYESCGTYEDWRLVTVSIWGVGRTAVGDMLKIVMDTFNAVGLALTVPNATFGQCWLTDNGIVRDPKRKDGDDVWIGRAVFEVQTTRQD